MIVYRNVSLWHSTTFLECNIACFAKQLLNIFKILWILFVIVLSFCFRSVHQLKNAGIWTDGLHFVPANILFFFQIYIHFKLQFYVHFPGNICLFIHIFFYYMESWAFASFTMFSFAILWANWFLPIVSFKSQFSLLIAVKCPTQQMYIFNLTSSWISLLKQLRKINVLPNEFVSIQSTAIV